MTSFQIPLKIYLVFGPAILLLSLFSLTSLPDAQASASWYPTFVGDTIKVRFCLPISGRLTSYLQVTDPPRGFKKNVAVIEARSLKKTPYCLRLMKDSSIPGSRPYQLEYEWPVNVSGSFALQLYVPSMKRSFLAGRTGLKLKTQRLKASKVLRTTNHAHYRMQ